VKNYSGKSEGTKDESIQVR